MIEAMRHRGPDDFGIHLEKDIAFGMARLSILDLSRAGHQPMSNQAKNIWIVYNGEMYNFLAEKKILEDKGYQFYSGSDTEVVLAMYEEYSDNFLLKMRGIFALAILDQRTGHGREKILLARDQLGVKPLLYSQRGNNFIFASELKSLLASGLIKKDIDPEALRELITYGSIIQPRTILVNVKMLLPGHRLIFQGNRQILEKYWRPDVDRFKELRNKSYSFQVKILRHELEETIKSQMISDAPIGAFLSGGVDSNLLVALMSKLTSRPVRTFSVGFQKEGEGVDETSVAKKYAKFFGSKHTELIVKARDVKKNINKFARALDQPSVDGINSFFVASAAKGSVKVAISGTGGDELFAGYPWFANVLSRQTKYLKDPLRKLLSLIFSQDTFNKQLVFGKFRDYIENFRRSGSMLAEYVRQYQILNSYSAGLLLAEKWQKRALVGREPAKDFAFSDEIKYADKLSRLTVICLKKYTQNQLLRDIDATAMFCSLEVRVPLLDKRIVDLALSLPTKSKLAKLDHISNFAENLTYRQSGAKRILIDSCRDLLPKNIDKQKKQGFTLPFNFWLKGELKEILTDTLSIKSVKERGFFNPTQANLYYQQYLAGNLDWPVVWLLMITELWSREVLDKC